MKKRRLLSPDFDNMFTDLSKNDLSNSNLKGKVKTVILSTESLKKRNNFFFEEEEDILKIEEYDKIGNQISMCYCNGKRTSGTFTKFISNECNQIIKEVTYEENPDFRELSEEDITGQIIYTYQNNKIISEFSANTDELFSAEYGSNGFINRIQVKSSLNREYTCYLERDQHKGNLITKINQPSDYVESIYYITYDQFENIILIQNEFILSGKEIKNEIKDVCSYKYDEYNNPIEKINGAGRDQWTDEFKYEYDNNKNWVRRFYYYKGGLSSIDNRVIEYY
jgi:hypothetical protein